MPSELLELLLQKSFCAFCLTHSFSNCCNWASNGFSKPSLCFCTSDHPMEICTDCFGSRGECAVIAMSLQTCHSCQTEGKLWSPKWWALFASHLDCLTLGGLTRLWVLGWTITFTRDGFVGFTEPPIKKLLFLSLTKHFLPPCTHYSVLFK